jgi:tetratricopeptide (TPR) repeat protein
MKALQIVEGTEHYSEMASAYNGLVALFNRKGDWQRANAYAEKGLRLRERIGDLQGVSQSYTNMGVIAWEQGDWVRALNYLERSLDIKQKIGDIQGIALLNNNLCELYSDLGNYPQAIALGEKALTIAEKIRHNNNLCQALNNLARVKILQNDFSAAIGYLTRCLDINKEMGSKEKIAEAEWLCAEAELGLDHLELARQAAEHAVALAAEIGRRLLEAKALRTLGKIQRRCGDLPAAYTNIENSCTILTALKNPFELAKSQYDLALIQRAQGQFADARRTLQQALDTFTRLGAEAEKTYAQRELAQFN